MAGPSGGDSSSSSGGESGGSTAETPVSGSSSMRDGAGDVAVDNASRSSGGESTNMKEVTVTVLSLRGVMANKRKKGGGGSSKASGNIIEKRETATIVASVPQTNIPSKDGQMFYTHAPTLPLALTSSHGLHSPSTDGDAAALSTIQFQRRFAVGDQDAGEDTSIDSAQRFVPQACPINLSISRHGKMALLGRVDLVIRGDEDGEAPVSIPITSHATRSKREQNGTANPVAKTAKKIRMKGKGSGSNKKNIHMVRIKGDSYQFSLQAGATVHLSVNVRGINEMKELPIKEAAAVDSDTATANEREGGEQASEETVEGSPSQLPPNEGSSSLGANHEGQLRNDAARLLENLTSSLLREQLARAEREKATLQMELASAMRTSANKDGIIVALREENKHLGELLAIAQDRNVAMAAIGSRMMAIPEGARLDPEEAATVVREGGAKLCQC